ncbi:fatty acid desaturase [Solirubrobacter sp. CPCC 204708]|uniref:Fatty acid desaturase n=1 Tax=Solirubrobacter deserti TaxID=2282478 RepID=A0ABT4RTW3_9ACTN|nr:fatty acid desaturase [Solirubrobacter deserti]MBE2317249.1 fatty acid desaturase [Solirubrobacter deserti]MDA0142016.1 fatty acid desaturase [Solirubrobacter deserti]
MTWTHRVLNLAGVVLPFVGVIVAIVLLWDKLVDWTSLAVMAFMYVVTIMGVTLGFHRLFTHRSFATYKPVEYFLAALGSVAVEGPVMNWVADHRKHHAHTDQEGDPHSPHGHGDGLKGAVSGLWYAHMGWLFDHSGTSEHSKYARDLYEDRGMQLIHKTFGFWVLVGIAVPGLLGLALTGSWRGAFEAALWGGPVRIFLVHHVTWSINSVCHFFGRRRFDVDDHSTNVAWLSLLSMGESWHHNHHTFPRSAFHGLKWWERNLDPTGWVIRAMRRMKLAWNVVEITPERQRQKLAA